MAILGPKHARIQVRLVRLPHDPENPIYFDEYTPLGEKENQMEEITRYIIPEETSYGIEVICKAGFRHRELNHNITTKLRDKTSDKLMFCGMIHEIDKTESGFEGDEDFPILSIPSATVDGKEREDVELSFYRPFEGW